MEHVVTALVVLAAVAFLGVRLRRTLGGTRDCSKGCGSCAAGPSGTDARLVRLRTGPTPRGATGRPRALP